MIRLASNSHTRAQILKAHNIDFIQSGGSFDEDLIQTTIPKSFVYEATIGKYQEALENFGYEKYPLLVADTVVTANNQLLRKAKDIDDAKRMLELQSGNLVSIITCMIYKSQKIELRDISYSDYIFAQFDKNELDKYLESGEWMGKAGAVMVEGFCKPYIKEVRGFESCAMGLTIEKLTPFL